MRRPTFCCRARETELEEVKTSVVVTDANVLINLMHCRRLGLLADLPGFEFVVPDHVAAEIVRAEQKEMPDEAVEAGIFRIQAITAVPVIKEFARPLSAYTGGVRPDHLVTRIFACFQGDLRSSAFPNYAPEKGPARSPTRPFRPEPGRFSLRFAVKKDQVSFRASKPAEQNPVIPGTSTTTDIRAKTWSSAPTTCRGWLFEIGYSRSLVTFEARLHSPSRLCYFLRAKTER